MKSFPAENTKNNISLKKKKSYSLMFRSKYKIKGEGFRNLFPFRKQLKLHDVFIEKMTIKIYKNEFLGESEPI